MVASLDNLLAVFINPQIHQMELVTEHLLLQETRTLRGLSSADVPRASCTKSVVAEKPNIMCQPKNDMDTSKLIKDLNLHRTYVRQELDHS